MTESNFDNAAPYVLLRVSHSRCAEHRATTFVCCPAEWTRDEIYERLHKAQEAYLRFLTAWKGEESPVAWKWNEDHAPDFASADSGASVGEIRAAWHARKAAHEAWEANRQKGYREFGDYLADQGFTYPWKINKADWGFSLDWGHNHGLGIRYGEEDLKDIPGPLVREEID